MSISKESDYYQIIGQLENIANDNGIEDFVGREAFSLLEGFKDPCVEIFKSEHKYMNFNKKLECNKEVVKMQIIPNPTKNNCIIQFQGLEKSFVFLEIRNLKGQLIEKLDFNSTQQKIRLETSSYSKGIYIINVLKNGQILAKKKLIIY
ncbi:MAG: T9SS type A sorting domain-containing protein [Bacteroidales bacterium]